MFVDGPLKALNEYGKYGIFELFRLISIDFITAVALFVTYKLSWDVLVLFCYWSKITKACHLMCHGSFVLAVECYETNAAKADQNGHVWNRLDIKIFSRWNDICVIYSQANLMTNSRYLLMTHFNMFSKFSSIHFRIIESLRHVSSVLHRRWSKTIILFLYVTNLNEKHILHVLK